MVTLVGKVTFLRLWNALERLADAGNPPDTKASINLAQCPHQHVALAVIPRHPVIKRTMTRWFGEVSLQQAVRDHVIEMLTHVDCLPNATLLSQLDQGILANIGISQQSTLACSVGKVAIELRWDRTGRHLIISIKTDKPRAVEIGATFYYENRKRFLKQAVQKVIVPRCENLIADNVPWPEILQTIRQQIEGTVSSPSSL